MNFCKVIHSINTGTGRLTTLLFHPEATNRRPSGILTTQERLSFHRSHLYPTSGLTCGWGNSQKASFVRPQIFLFGQPQLVTLHVCYYTGAPHYMRGAGADESCSELYKKARTNVPEVDIWKQAPQGLQKTLTLGLSGLFIRGLFSRASKSLLFLERGGGRDVQVNA